MHGTNPRVAELTEERDREAQLQERRKQVAGSIQQLKKMKETLEGRIKCVGVVVVVVWGWGDPDRRCVDGKEGLAGW